MAVIPSLSSSSLENLARVLAEAATHEQHTKLLASSGFIGVAEGAKWRRIFAAFEARQKTDKCANNVIGYTKLICDPVRSHNDAAAHRTLIEAVNGVLAFNGISLGLDGVPRSISKASTVSQSQAAANQLRHKLVSRDVHPDVVAFCRAELLDSNYFHAVLEATKSLAEKIRLKSGLVDDGAPLVDAAFCGKAPILAINSLRTSTERSEQSGFANLLKGVFGTFRNPSAHAPKISWMVSEQDALDLLTMLSYLHRRLDNTHKTSPHAGGNPT
jgi:uncharacterized protein (TIGR02391 family)